MSAATMEPREIINTKRFYWAIITAIVVLFAIGFLVRSNNVRTVPPMDPTTTAPGGYAPVSQ